MKGHLAALRRRVVSGWTASPDDPDTGPLLDSAFLQRLEHFALRAGRGSTTGFAGEHPSRRKAHSVEFADYRDYRPGDDFRLIDWNVYARLGELTLRLTEATESTTLHLLLDCSASMGWGRPSKFRAAQRLAAALGCIGLSRYDAVSLSILRGDRSSTVPLLRGKNGLPQLLHVLEDLRPEGTLALEEAVYAYCRSARQGLVVLLSDLLTPTGTAGAIAALRRMGLATTIVQLLAREEQVPYMDGRVALMDSETGATIALTVDHAVLRAYATRFAAWTAEIEAACARHQASFVRWYTDQPVEDLVFGPLRGQVLQ
jgi:uncharacterized protein (DUF58 family)